VIVSIQVLYWCIVLFVRCSSAVIVSLHVLYCCIVMFVSYSIAVAVSIQVLCCCFVLFVRCSSDVIVSIRVSYCIVCPVWQHCDCFNTCNLLYCLSGVAALWLCRRSWGSGALFMWAMWSSSYEQGLLSLVYVFVFFHIWTWTFICIHQLQTICAWHSRDLPSNCRIVPADCRWQNVRFNDERSSVGSFGTTWPCFWENVH